MSNRLKIYDDPQMAPGTVIIAVASPDLDPAKAAVTIARRNPDRPHLGPFGWQAAEHAFKPLAIRSAAQRTELIFGSELTRHLAVDMDVSVAITAAGIRERHFWPDIATEHGDGSLLLDMPGRRLVKGPDQSRPPGGSGGGGGLEETGGLDIKGPDGIDETETRVVVEPAIPIGKNRTLLLSILASLILFTGLVVGLYLYLSPPDSRRPGEQQSDSQTTENTGPPAPPAPALERQEAPVTPPPVVNPPPVPPAPNFASRYRDYLNQQGHADDLLTLGHEALSANETEVGFNAVTLSADRGSAAAKYLMGQWYDPMSPNRQLVTANPNNAALYYGDATALGSEEARSALKKLCDAAAATTAAAPGWSADFDRKTYCQ